MKSFWITPSGLVPRSCTTISSAVPMHSVPCSWRPGAQESWTQDHTWHLSKSNCHQEFDALVTKFKASFQLQPKPSRFHGKAKHIMREGTGFGALCSFLLKNQQALGKIWRKLKGSIKSRWRKYTGMENHKGHISHPRAGKPDEQQFCREQFNSSYCTHCTYFS